MIYNVISYLKNAALRDPDQIALSDAAGSISYRNLWDCARAVGTCLGRMMSGKRKQPIPVYIDRSVQSVVAFYGVVCSGNFYVPVDPSLPDKRLCEILGQMSPEIVLTACTAESVLLPQNCKVISVQEALNTVPDDALIASVLHTSCDTDPLYCIFTSGSSGVPKGVLVSHRSVINMTRQFSDAFSFDRETVFGNQAPFDFDVSVKDLYNALRHGARVHILDKSLFLMPKRLIQALDEYRVNTLIWAASALKIVSALHTFDKIVPQYLQRVMFSGETLPCRVLNDWMDHLPGVRFVNLYGPTEITCNCTYFAIDRRFADDAVIPIGKPFPNTEILLLNGSVPVCGNDTGEICVRGTCLALGYYGNPEKTAESFCQNPLNSNYPDRIYRTGDLAKRDADGNLIFAGRADSQIKHMGHRIELGEIEAASGAIAFIDSACCLYDAKKEKILLFYQAKEQDDKAVFALLKKALPDYMIPNALIYFHALPENRTGKIDRALLRKQYIES